MASGISIALTRERSAIAWHLQAFLKQARGEGTASPSTRVPLEGAEQKNELEQSATSAAASL